jgi:carbon starvation protein
VNTLPLLLIVMGIFVVAYRYYSALLATRAFMLDDRNITPAHRFKDGHNYVPSPKWVVFGHHFRGHCRSRAAGWAHAGRAVRLRAGVDLAGRRSGAGRCVQDMTVLIGSLRHNGKSLPYIVQREVGPVTGMLALIAVLLILIVAMAGLAIIVVNALSQSAWGIFTIGMTIPIAMMMGLWMFRINRGKVVCLGPSVFGVIALLAALIGGHWIANSSLCPSAAFQSARDRAAALRLWLSRFRVAGMDAA